MPITELVIMTGIVLLMKNEHITYESAKGEPLEEIR